MSEEYITQKMLDASISRLEGKMDAFTEKITRDFELFREEMKARDAEMRAVNAKHRRYVDNRLSSMETQIVQMNGRIDKIEMRLDGLSLFIGWTIGISGVLIALGTIVIQLLMR